MTKSKMYKYKYAKCTSIYIKGLFFLEFQLEDVDCGSHLCIEIETVPETGPTIRKGFLPLPVLNMGIARSVFEFLNSL